MSEEKKKPKPREEELSGQTYKVATGCGNLYVTLNEDNGNTFEVFTRMGKTGGCAMAQSEAVSRLCSLALRSDIDPQAIIKQLKGIRCPNPSIQKGGIILSCPDAVAKSIERRLIAKGVIKPPKASIMLEIQKNTKTLEATDILGMCKQEGCGGVIISQSGCDVCQTCGHSERCD